LSAGFCPYDVLRIALGVLLLFAGALKAHELATEPVLGGSLLESRWFLVALVECEILFGLWLWVVARARRRPRRGNGSAFVRASILRRLLVCVALSLPLLFGCGQYTGHGDGATEDMLPISPPGTSRVGGSGKREIVLRHDFGILRTMERVNQQFAIHNDSSLPWTIDHVQSTCGCSLPSASAQTILPGVTEKLSMVYSTGPHAGDRNSVSRLVFREEDAPAVLIEITSRVRDRLTLLPKRFMFADVDAASTCDRTLEIQNFGDADWGSLALSSDANWLEVADPVRSTTSRCEQAREVWVANVRVRMAGCRQGRHYGNLIVRAKEAGAVNSQQGVVPVEVFLMSAVQPIPEQLFFGLVQGGVSTKRTIIIRFTSTSAPNSPESLIVTHDLGSELQIEWLRASGRFWELGATLTPMAGKGDRLLKAAVDIRSEKSGCPEVRIPVYAHVVE
jgi:hypothetical protein